MKPARIGGLTPSHQIEVLQDPTFDNNEISFWLALVPGGSDQSLLDMRRPIHGSLVC